MSDIMIYLALFFMLATAGVLVAGLYNLMKGGSNSTSQNLMRARILLQGLAVLVLVAVLLFAR
ncbi:twin transmembrane helix small protein [Aurantimonas sp. C2-6-R+9]|uniref:twin transmembrane helix small protein n=1 Tax=unclassified Aurantimonas TaxID=2638230 RepID=UPI002E187408|nr:MULTISPECIES: twin transmembrane helix small protein [unclassified Aurantimonas]MEC5291757.1 twin transmembrane helix small protein [Aurantimonas sp. C2-3-R2]MEC5381978.1 twin transmembrane helix small protein [Aurantimonas sp. C2-6-R+9]MEC5412842.1 twin transmembrane helix small protein [Aurantimonas sp. C2-4-R8]